MRLVPQDKAPSAQLPSTRFGGTTPKGAEDIKRTAAVLGQVTEESKKAEAIALAKSLGYMPPTEQAAPVSKPTTLSQISSEQFDKVPSLVQGNPSESTSSVQEVSAAEPVTPPADPNAERFEALARRERAMRARAQADLAKSKQREDAIAAREAALAAKEASYTDPTKYIAKDKFQTDTLNALVEAGLNYDQITDLMLKTQSGDIGSAALKSEVQTLKAELAAIRQAQEASSKAYEDNQKTAYDQALKQISVDVRRAVRGNAEFESIEKTNSYGEVVDLIKQVYEKGLGDEYPAGTILDIYEASKMVEAEISEDLYKYASSISKVQKRLSPQQAQASASQASQASGTKEQQLNTLTNRMPTGSKLSAVERAKLAFQGIDPNSR